MFGWRNSQIYNVIRKNLGIISQIYVKRACLETITCDRRNNYENRLGRTLGLSVTRNENVRGLIACSKNKNKQNKMNDEPLLTLLSHVLDIPETM